MFSKYISGVVFSSVRIEETKCQNTNLEKHYYSPLHVSHRGGGGLYAPENTTFAFRKSLRYATDVLEMDVRQTKDGVLVCLHDEDLSRTTNGTGSIRNFTYAEVKRLDAAYRFKQFLLRANQEQRQRRQRGVETVEVDGEESIETWRQYESDTRCVVPRLDETLAEFAREKVFFFLDLKQVAVVPKTIALVKELGLERRVMYGAIFSETAKILRKHISEDMLVAIDAASMGKLYLSHVFGLPLPSTPYQIIGIKEPVYKDVSILSSRLVQKIKAAGKRFAVFGPALSQPHSIEKCLNLEVDMLFSSRPDILRKTIDQWMTNRPEMNKPLD